MSDSTAVVVLSNRNGGPIRPTAQQVRDRCRQSFAERIPTIEGIADTAEAKDALKAIDLLGKYAGLAQPDLAGAQLTVHVYGGIGLGSPNSAGNGSPGHDLASADPQGAGEPIEAPRGYVGHPGSLIVPAVHVEGLGLADDPA